MVLGGIATTSYETERTLQKLNHFSRIDLPTIINWTRSIQILWFWGGIFTLNKFDSTVSKQRGSMALNWVCTVCPAMSHKMTICSYGSSLSHTEHTAYTGHSSVSVKAVYDFSNFKKTDTGTMSVYNRISDRTRP